MQASLTHSESGVPPGRSGEIHGSYGIVVVVVEVEVVLVTGVVEVVVILVVVVVLVVEVVVDPHGVEVVVEVDPDPEHPLDEHLPVQSGVHAIVLKQQQLLVPQSVQGPLPSL